MKKLLLTILLIVSLGIGGCATQQDLVRYQEAQEAQAAETRLRLAAIEKGGGVSPERIMELLEGSEVTKIRAHTGLEGDTTGTLDKIDIASISDGYLVNPYEILRVRDCFPLQYLNHSLPVFPFPVYSYNTQWLLFYDILYHIHCLCI